MLPLGCIFRKIGVYHCIFECHLHFLGSRGTSPTIRGNGLPGYLLCQWSHRDGVCGGGGLDVYLDNCVPLELIVAFSSYHTTSGYPFPVVCRDQHSLAWHTRSSDSKGLCTCRLGPVNFAAATRVAICKRVHVILIRWTRIADIPSTLQVICPIHSLALLWWVSLSLIHEN